MKTDHILKADVLDIIFDNRNKSYGAYILRKFYQDRLYKALGLTFIFIALLMLFVLFQKNEKNSWKPELDTTTLVNIARDVIQPAEPVKPVMPPKANLPASLPKLKSEVFVSQIKIVPNDVAATKLPENIENSVISNVANNVVNGARQLVHGGPAPQTQTGEPAAVAKAVDKTKPVSNLDVAPAFPGGEAALIKFLQSNLQNPQALEEGEMVTVKIRFIVGYDGILKGFETLQDGGAAFNNEVIRVLKKMPSWIPGRNGGENVAVYYSIPVKFVPQD
ncbi:energy transducer TonB [soil metagenome]